MKIQRSITNQGIKLIHYELPSTKSLTASVIVNAGSSDEQGDEEYGIAHFIEHMTGNGTQKYPDPRESNLISEQHGIIENAWTYKYLTVYYAKSPIENIKKAIEIIIERVWFPLLTKEAALKEKGVILEELSYRDNDPSTKAYDAFEDIIFDYKPLRHDTGGTKESVSSIDHKMLRSFYNRNYTNRNITLFTSGNASIDEIQEIINTFKTPSKPEKDMKSLRKDLKVPTKNYKFLKSDTKLYHVLFGINSLTLDPITFNILQVIKVMLGVGKGSILNIKLNVENQLVSNYGIDLLSFPHDGALMFYFATDDKNVLKTMKQIISSIENLRSGDIKKDALKRAINLIKSAWLKLSESSDSYIDEIGYYNLVRTEILTGKEVSLSDTINSVQTVDRNTIQNTLSAVLQNGRYACAILGQEDNFKYEVQKLFKDRDKN